MKITLDDIDFPDWHEPSKGQNMPTEPEETMPPRQPNTFRTWLPRIWAWLLANPIWFAAGIGFLTGLILPPMMRALF